MNQKKTNILAVLFLSVLVLILAGLLIFSGIKYHKMSDRLKASQEELEKVQQLAEQREEAASQKEDTTAETEEEQGILEDQQEEVSKEKKIYATVMDIPAGKKINQASVNMENLGQYFMSSEISDDVYERINGKSYRENPDIGIEDLRYLKVLHYNYDHQIQVGEMIVNVQLAEEVCNIFHELFENEYEIYSMYLVDNFWTGDGDSSDYASIDVNNTSCFNYREQTGGGALSNHAYGCAIDLNPMENPYVVYDGDTPVEWAHSNADPYIDRNSGAEHVITHDDVCYQIFAKYGYSWGGDWSNPKDFQHFEKRLYG